MSIWSKIRGSINGDRAKDSHVAQQDRVRDVSRFAFVDIEVGVTDKKIHDIGTWRWDDAKRKGNYIHVGTLNCPAS